MRRKRIIALVLVVSMLMGMNKSVMGAAAPTQKSAEKTEKMQEYLVTAEDGSKYEILKQEMNQTGKRVIHHKKSDEKYLEDSQSIVVKLTPSEADRYTGENGIKIEKEKKLTACGELTDEEIMAEYTAVEVAMDKYETGEEYSDNPYNFKPCKGIAKGKNKNEVIPWNISCVAGTPHKNTYRGKGVKVAVIDSGIDTHDELNTKEWVDFSDSVNGYKPTDHSGHGTSMAGVIAGRVNGIGMEGIADQAEIYSVKVLNKDNTASVSAAVKALEWCIENDMDIVNMSFGMDSSSRLLQEVVTKAYQKGILMVAAAGNDTDAIQYPAAYPEVLSVGSVDETLKASDFSDNKGVDLVAPGENAQTIGFVGSYTKMEGTSIAAAHVTGVAAAVKSARRAVSVEKLKNALLASGVQLADGSKLVNYQNAIRAVKSKEFIKLSVSGLKKETKEKAEDKESYVQGSWSMERWLDGSATSGHYTIINNIPLSYFSFGAANDTEKTNNRWITAISAQRTDSIKRMSASGTGNSYRNANGEIADGTTKCYSPYHAKSDYTLAQVVQHLGFLYELARRRLVLNQDITFNVQGYTNNEYYGAKLDNRMIRRIIVDLRELYNNLVSYYSGTGVKINSVAGRGYMVLGVFLHLVQDMEAHRAIVSRGIIFSGSGVGSYYTSDKSGGMMGECRINGNNIYGNPDSGTGSYSYTCLTLYNQLLYATMPIIRLKDYLKGKNEDDKTRCTITYQGKTYRCLGAQAYEDNPYFASYRFSFAQNYSQSYIDRMKSDTGATSDKLTSYCSNAANPLYVGTYSQWKE